MSGEALLDSNPIKESDTPKKLEEPSWPPRQTLRNAPLPVLIASGLTILAILFCGIEYIRLARMIDRHLASGPFSTSTDIFSAPELLAVGEPMSAAELTGKLERSGLTRSHDNPDGWFEPGPNAIRISLGDDNDIVQIGLAGGKISNINSGTSGALQQYQLGPQLITNLGAAREKRRLVRFADIPPALVHAILSTEDRRFFRHGGIDFRRAAKAAWVDLKDGRKEEGASTLTMQLARSLWLDPGKSWRRKFEEILITLHLEHKLTKRQILEDYANQIYLGRSGTFSINGVGEAAHAFFGKELPQIDTAEAALLAGVIRRPSYYNPFRYPERAIHRRNLVLALMVRNHELGEAEYRAASAEPLKLAPGVADDSANSYFLSLVNDDLQSTVGDSAKAVRSVVTTLDPNLQTAAEAAVRMGMDEVDRQLRGRGKLPSGEPQVALVAIDPRTGEVKAMVGGRNYAANQLNHALAMRQPGSVFKPFVYAAAIDTGVEGGAHTFTPASLLEDNPETTFSFNGNTYQPRDFQGDYEGEVPLRTALALSLNVATVSLAQQVGYKNVVAMAQRAGLNRNIRPTPSVALGAYETSPMEIAGAYTVFANGGIYTRPSTISAVKSADGSVLYQHQIDSRKALDPRVAYIMTNLMQDVINSGTGAGVRARGFYLPAAGKTGTSRDGWFAGFTTQLLCVVWVGFDDNRDLNLEGARSALPIWAEFMKRAAQFPPYNAARQFTAPPGVTSAEICTDSGELATPNCPNTRQEIFISGTEPGTLCHLHH